MEPQHYLPPTPPGYVRFHVPFSGGMQYIGMPIWLAILVAAVLIFVAVILVVLAVAIVSKKRREDVSNEQRENLRG